MKLVTPVLAAMLSASTVAHSQSGPASGVPSVAIPKTTAVLVIETPRPGVTPEDIMKLIPDEI